MAQNLLFYMYFVCIQLTCTPYMYSTLFKSSELTTSLFSQEFLNWQPFLLRREILIKVDFFSVQLFDILHCTNMFMLIVII